jgi:hypothetical protein
LDFGLPILDSRMAKRISWLGKLVPAIENPKSKIQKWSHAPPFHGYQRRFRD